MGHGEGRGGQELDDVVAIGDGVHAVAADGGETEVSGERGTVDGIRRAGEGGAAEGHDIGAGQSIAQAAGVAFRHFNIGEQVMGEKDGLGALEVSVAGQDGIDALLCLLQ